MNKNKNLLLKILGIVFIVSVGIYLFWPPAPKGFSGRAESITIAYSPFESAALHYIAEDQRFYARNGLNLTSRQYATGAASLEGVMNGEADISVGVSEFPMVGRVFQRAKIGIIGNIDKAEFIFLVGRKDRGLEKVSDLKGKRIGTTFGTVAHFHLGRFLNLNGLDIRDLTLVDVKTPKEWVSAVADGVIDVIATAQPYANQAKERLGDKAVFWPAQSGQPLHGLVISSHQWITKHPELTRRFLKALAEAEEYVIRHPVQAKSIVQKRLNLNPAYMETVWSQNQFSLSLDQALIVTMEDEARWMIKNSLTREKQVPNFLAYIYEDGLKAVKPEAVRILR